MVKSNEADLLDALKDLKGPVDNWGVIYYRLRFWKN